MVCVSQFVAVPIFKPSDEAYETDFFVNTKKVRFQFNNWQAALAYGIIDNKNDISRCAMHSLFDRKIAFEMTLWCRRLCAGVCSILTLNGHCIII